MTPLLLALASLTPGDGGPGGGAAREAVTPPLRFGSGFSGYIRLPGGPLCPVELEEGQLRVGGPTFFRVFDPCSLRPEGNGRFRLTGGSGSFDGTVHRRSGRIVLTLDTSTAKPNAEAWRSLIQALGRKPPKP